MDKKSAFTAGIVTGIEKTSGIGGTVIRGIGTGAMMGGFTGSLSADPGRRAEGALKGAAFGGAYGGLFSPIKSTPITLVTSALGGLAGGSMSTDGYEKFKETLKLDPNSHELDKAFAAYEKDTGKNNNMMTQGEIVYYVKKIRRGK